MMSTNMHTRTHAPVSSCEWMGAATLKAGNSKVLPLFVAKVYTTDDNNYGWYRNTYQDNVSCYLLTFLISH